MNKKSLLIIMYLFFQGIIHNLGHPVTPKLVNELGIPNYMFGLFFAAMSFGLMIGAPLWGSLSDRGKRTFWIAFGLTFYTIGQLGFGYIEHSVGMVVFRLFAGFGVVSAITIFTAMIVEQTPVGERAKVLAFMAASSTLGASLGYYLGGFLATNMFMKSLLGTGDLSRIFLIQAIANAMYTLLIVATLRDNEEKKYEQKKISMIQGLKSIAKIDIRVLLFLVSVTLINMGSTNLSKYIDVYFIDLGYTEQDLGTYVMITGIVSLLASIFLVRLASRFKKQLVFIQWMQIISAIIVYYVFISSYFMTMMYTVYLVYVIFKTLYVPLEQSYIAKEAKPGQYGSIMGIRQSFVSLGMVLGPVLGGFLYDRSPRLLFDFNGALFIIAVFILWMVGVMEKKSKTNEPLSDSVAQ